MITKLILILIIGFVPNISFAETYWVSPTGAAADMASCSGSTPLSGTDACTRTKAMAFALQPGDVVYFRAGTYTVASSGLDYEGIKLAAKCGGGSWKDDSDADTVTALSSEPDTIRAIGGSMQTNDVYLDNVFIWTVSGI